MYPIQMSQLAAIIGGRIHRGSPRKAIRAAIQYSSKYIRPGVVFFLNPKKIKNMDAVMRNLRTTRAGCIVVPTGWEHRIPAQHAVIRVSDPFLAALKLAKWQYAQCHHPIVIGVTGSCGKSTTKEMVASILMQKYRTLKSWANNNVFASIPSHFFRLHPSHQVVVLEMGMANFGNIRSQCLFSKPSIGVITNVGRAHVGKLGSSVENVARAKQEMIDGLRPGGTIVLNEDDPGTRKLSLRRFHGKVVTFGIDRPADVKANNIRFTREGISFQVNRTSFFIPVLGTHNVYNALAAIAVGRLMKVPTKSIQRGLRSFTPPPMRLQPLRGINGYTLINDAYNANPDSMIAGLKVLKKIGAGRTTVAVLGDMSELGKLTESGHREVGRKVARLHIDYLFTIGPRARSIATAAKEAGMPVSRIRSFSTEVSLVNYLRHHLSPGAVLYFKASRSMKLEQCIKPLCIR
ncbi:UDP-N-acetylmuramoyl-tripeptide--D-alanyl-D-alanine ligase [Polycladomyces subterraneus]|uniref:UDP-N-acetylmuramoyl-tripeptide--D-alanyl-D-alanine ligase n=1 Tax=Polycladomyces subterraneus TaxID=1016997 RepID=A0ABT8IJG7_9BACL|nr:UDP-N-acetylmuramoyl-tripeptide--D-alanyl-D-alanine ligase [Polycladomyces subterraneus]MDN4592923.1 UDP-N-acetylmuramoyl-tripeptide--D-alanyl-D-alanine ligase [Polycladomyces subterraneus]